MTATDLSPTDYVAEMVGALSTVAADAAGHDLRPCYLQVNRNALDDLLHDQPWHVNVQLDDEAAVDTLAEFYSLPVDDGEGLTYSRRGIVATGDDELHVQLYCGRGETR